MALAFAAALALNGGYLMQHVGSSTTMAIDPRRPIATLSALLRSPLWTLGSLAGLSGWALHIGAMREAPLSLVQACVAGGLALAAPMAAIGLRRRLARSETQALAVMVVALVLLSLGLTAHRHAGFHPAALAACTAVLAAAAVALAIRARGRPVVRPALRHRRPRDQGGHGPAGAADPRDAVARLCAHRLRRRLLHVPASAARRPAARRDRRDDRGDEPQLDRRRLRRLR
jgi:hypothetical protein